MKMDNNINEDGMGKYALINLRKLRELGYSFTDKHDLVEILTKFPAAIEWGNRDSEFEFFVMKLKDTNARAALLAYAENANGYDKEWALEVIQLANRAGILSKFHKRPD